MSAGNWLDMFRPERPPEGPPAGRLVVSDEQALTPRMHVISYDRRDCAQRRIEKVEEIPALMDPEKTNWINVQGLGDEKFLQQIGELFSLHPLVIEDVMEAAQRPKVEWHDEYIFLVYRVPLIATDSTDSDVELRQISVFLGKNYVLSFQEKYDDFLRPVSDRIVQSKGAIRREGADYLFYSIIDAVIDAYFPVLEEFGESLEDLDDEVMEAPTQATLAKANRIRSSLVYLRRTVRPQREAINALLRHESALIGKPIEVYLRDCYDHCLQISEMLESYRELVAAINSTYLSAVSNRMNEVMKVLTIMASIFVPLTFIAGVYGMNFEHMPELQFDYAYPLVWLTMVLTAGGMLLYFRKRGWIGSDKGDESEDDHRS